MKKSPVRLCTLLLCGALLLTGCGAKEPAREGFETGYQAGYEAGFADGAAAHLPPEAELTPSEEEEAAPGEEEGLPQGFVYLTDVVPEVLLDLRYFGSYNFVGERIEGYEAPTAILTEAAALALGEVSRDLEPLGYRLKIYDAYRPQRAVDHFCAWAEDPEKEEMKPWFYPEIPKEELFQRGYVAARSGHSRGSTVDLTLFDLREGRDADMGGGFDFFGPRSHSDFGELTKEQRANRKLLRDTMLSHGFRGISTEWWHFTLQEEPFPDTYFDFPVRAG